MHCLPGVGTDLYLSIQHNMRIIILEKSYYKNDWGWGGGGMGTPSKGTWGLIVTSKFRVIVTTPPNPKQKPNSNYISEPHTEPHGTRNMLWYQAFCSTLIIHSISNSWNLNKFINLVQYFLNSLTSRGILFDSILQTLNFDFQNPYQNSFLLGVTSFPPKTCPFLITDTFAK